MLDTLGIERMVVVQASCYGEDNRRTVGAVRSWACIARAASRWSAREVTEPSCAALHDGGIRATRFITTAKGGPSLDELPGVAAQGRRRTAGNRDVRSAAVLAGDPAGRRRCRFPSSSITWAA